MPILTTGAGVYAAAGGGGSPIVITEVSAPAINTASGTTSTFTVNVGAPSSGRILVVCIGLNNSTGLSGVTLAGNAMTLAVAATVGNSRQTLIYSVVDAATNGSTSVVITTTGASLNTNGIIVYSITGSATPTPNTTATQTYGYAGDNQVTSGALTIPSNGGAIVIGCSETTSVTPFWNTGVSSTSDALTTASGFLIASMHIATTGSVTPSVSGPNGAGWGMAAASWGP